MVLTANYIINAAEPLVELWSQLECDIQQDIARRLVKCEGKLTATAQWQTIKAREVAELRRALSANIARVNDKTDSAVTKLVRDAAEEALAFDDALYRKAGLAPLALGKSPALLDVLNAGIRKTKGLMTNFTGTTANTATRAFENALDRAYMQVTSGAFSLDEAMRRAIRELAKQGVHRIVYPSGSTAHVDVAVRRALTTGLNQTAAELQLARMDEMDAHLVEVTSHAGARPTHAEWQGQIYWHGERVRGYENLEDATGYGTGDGLCGWNCYHSFYPYFEGLSRRAFERDPSARRGKSNEQMYEESQRQRALERSIRQSRRECATYAAARDAERDPIRKAALEKEFAAVALRLKRQEHTLTDFCEETSRTKLTDRLFVPSYNRSVSAKVTWAVRKSREKE